VKALRSSRLLLREWSDDDVDVVLDTYSRWEVQRFLGGAPKVMRERAEAVDAIARWRALQDPICGLWAVELQQTGAVVGNLLLKDIPLSSDETLLPPSGDIEIGWHFHPDAWGHGYATEAATTVLDYGFANGLERVVAVTYPENVASQRVCTRIGMHHEGPTNRYYNVTLELFAIDRPGTR
jgi:RimJ/RimL family protein N-acetyltransferase